MADTQEHSHHRPDWNCLTCGQPWPCPDARADLLVQFRGFPSVLVIYLADRMREALHDFTLQGDPAAIDTHRRFLGWVRHFLR